MTNAADAGVRKLSDEELTVAAGSIPLPPEELWDELDNQKPAEAPAAPSAVKPAVAVLDFVAGPPSQSIELLFPFRLDGQLVETVTVRPLTVVETSAVIQAKRAEGSVPENMDFYAVMTGLPTAVIRAMPGADGEGVTEAAYAFLPRFMKGAA